LTIPKFKVILLFCHLSFLFFFCKSIEIDEARHEVSYKGAGLGLTTKEFSLMATLARHPGRVFTRSQLLEQIWGNEYYDDHVVDVHIGNLRKKLEAGDEQTPYIETIRGVGYRFGAKYEIPSDKI
jgi:two-component system, OmpR family, alkaline phosphatase synthesis response regulator PhoP